MAKALLKLAPVRVGLERPWAFREDYRKAVQRHNARAMAAILLLVPLMVASVILLQPGTAQLSLPVRKAIAGGLFVAWFAVIVGFLLWRARKDCDRFRLHCPACGKDLYGSKRMRTWLEGDTQSIGCCPHCRGVIQCARAGTPLADPVEGTPIPPTLWEKRRWIQRGGLAALLASAVLMYCGALWCPRLIRAMSLPVANKKLLAMLCLLLICGAWLVLVRGIVRMIGTSARKAGLTCSRCAEPLTGRRVVCEEAATPPRLTCLACGTLMRVEARCSPV